MTTGSVNGGGNGERSGAQTLLLLAAPLNVAILRALATGPKQQVDLRRATGFPAQTTLRAQLKRLAGLGVIDKHRRNAFPGTLEHELTSSGQSLLAVADVAGRWLGEAPETPLPMGDSSAKAAIKALAEGWSTTMLRALAARSMSLTELDGVIGAISYPSLERRLTAMRLAGLVEPCRSNGRATPYTVTSWAQRGVAPLLAAARWERSHRPQATAPVSGLDVEAVFLLAMPTLNLPADLSGCCRLGVERSGKRPASKLAGVQLDVSGGKIELASTRLRGNPEAWALGSLQAWLDALLDGNTEGLELGGRLDLVRPVVDGLHRGLFRAKTRRHP